MCGYAKGFGKWEPERRFGVNEGADFRRQGAETATLPSVNRRESIGYGFLARAGAGQSSATALDNKDVLSIIALNINRIVGNESGRLSQFVLLGRLKGRDFSPRPKKGRAPAK